MNTKTSILLRTDKKLKEKASIKARSYGMTLTAWVNVLLRESVENDLDIRFEPKEKLNLKTRKILEDAEKEIDTEIFTVDGAIAYLKTL